MQGHLEDVYIVGAVRTPIGSFGSSLKSFSAVDLGIAAVKAVIKKSGRLPKEVDGVIIGCVLSAGLGQNVARQIALKSDISTSSKCFTVNKVCSSGMTAIILAAQQIKLGSSKIIIAGGTESMSNTPFYLPRNIPFGGTNLEDGVQKDGLVESFLQTPMGCCAEKTVSDLVITRKEQDEFAITSYRRSESAWEMKLFDEEVISVSYESKGRNIEISQDEGYTKLNVDKVPHLKASFAANGTITAANASTISDGAAALLLIGGRYLINGMVPLAKIVGFTEAGTEPIDFSIAPVIAVRKLLSDHSLSVNDISLWEVNEAFAATAILFIKELNLDKSCVNVRGGAVALGHPLGASGARIVVTLVHALRPSQLGVAAICNAGGEATALLIKRL